VPDPLDQPSAPAAPGTRGDDLAERQEVDGMKPAGSDSGSVLEEDLDDVEDLDEVDEGDPTKSTDPTDGDGGDDGNRGGADDEGDDKPGKAEPAKRSRLRSTIEWAVVILGALLVAFVVRTTIAQAFWIPSVSMEPTLHEGDRVLVNKLSYRLHDVNRGDIIVFERPATAASINPEDDIKDLIKRVIGLPGDTIEARPDGSVYINDHRLEEPYLPSGTRTLDLPRQEVPEGHIFVMGDNRGDSQDSRVFGPVDEDLIVGRAFLRIYPLGDIGGL
jgi:signal peptidase I